jgi:hypothetical protein
MDLCNLCKKFDIRQLLCQSAAQNPGATGNTDRNFIDTKDYRAPMPNFYKHRDSITALKIFADQGCELCSLFWCSWVKTLNKNDITAEFLEKYFPGQLYIGCSSWTTSKQGFPYITLTQQSPTGSSRTLCSFEAFANRGTCYINFVLSPETDFSQMMSQLRDNLSWAELCIRIQHPRDVYR